MTKSRRYDRAFVGSAGGATAGRRCFDRSAHICTGQQRQLDLRPPGVSGWQQLIAGAPGPGGHESIAPETSYGYRPNVERPNFLAGAAAFGTFAAGGLAPHIGQAIIAFPMS